MKHLNTLLSVFFIIIIGVLGFATFVEQAQGSLYSSAHVYHTWWFFALWTVLALLAAVTMWRRRLWKRAAVFVLHLSLLVILLGAAVTFFTSREGVLHLRKGVPAKSFVLKSSGQTSPLPFRQIVLRNFNVECYPGTEAPQDFISHVDYQTVDGTAHQGVISMNNILRAEGFRFYQSSFDPDLKGSVLTVNYDPWGTAITYFGYLLLAVSMVWVLLGRHERFRALLALPLLKKGFMAAVVMAVALWSAPVQARSVPTINRDKAERLARMPIVYNDRVAPLSTLAHDVVQKLYGSTTYKGLSSEQVVYGWLRRPDAWKDEPMLKIKDAKLRDYLGVKGKYARFSDLFDSYQQYKLQPLIGSGDDDKAVRELDEKVGIILMLTRGSLIRPARGVEVDNARLEAEVIYNEFPVNKPLAMVNLTLGLIVFAAFLFPRFRRRRLVLMAGWWLQVVGLSVLAVAYALRWYISGRIPLSNGYETMLFMSLAILAVAVVVSRKLAVVLPFGFLLSGFTLLVSFLGQMNPQITPLMPVLQSPLLSIHVSVVMMAYALLAFTMLCGVTVLLQCRRHDVEQVEMLTVLSRLMLYPAVFLLAAGIFIGAVWANVSWGKYWSWDPKEVWALITLMVYAVPLHRSTFWRTDKPIAYHVYMVAAFLSVLMTYFGVNYFLGGMHSYA